MLSDRMTAFIRSLPERREYTREELLVPATKLAEEPTQRLVVYDAPIGWVNRGARVALIGVTPGFTATSASWPTARARPRSRGAGRSLTSPQRRPTGRSSRCTP